MGNEQSAEAEAAAAQIKAELKDQLYDEDSSSSSEEEVKSKFQLFRSKTLPDKPPAKTLLHKASDFRRSSGLSGEMFTHEETVKKPVKLRKQNTVKSISEDEDEASHHKTNNTCEEHKVYEVSYIGQEPIEGAKFTEIGNREMWEKVVKTSIMGSNLLEKSAVFNLFTGGVFACSPPDFMPTMEQIKVIAVGLHRPSSLAATGIFVAGDEFRYETAKVGKSLFGVAENGEHILMIHVGSTSAMAVVYERKLQEDAIKLVEELCEYFSEGFGF